MPFDTHTYQHYTIVTIQTNNFNSLVAPEFKSHMVYLHNEEQVRNVIIDMSNVEFVDSSGLSAVLVGYRLWKDDGAFILANVHHQSVKTLIEISRLEDVFIIIPTLQEAIDFVIMEELERELLGEEE